jgi:hypothetical protein
MSKKILFLSLNLFFALASTFSQVTESALSSNLIWNSLPANALQIRPARISEKTSSRLGKSASMGDGKSRPGDREVLAWAGNGYQKSKAATIVKRLTGKLKVADLNLLLLLIRSTNIWASNYLPTPILFNKSTNRGSFRSGAKSTSLSSQISQMLRSS